jgi:hypothetical protein
MSKTTEQIEAHIHSAQNALRSNLDELENKVKSASDWRRIYARHPGAMAAAAFGAGALLALVSGRRSGSAGQTAPASEPRASADPPPSSGDRRPDGVVRQIWDPVKEALIGVAVVRATGFVQELLGGSRENQKRKSAAGTGSAPGP